MASISMTIAQPNRQQYKVSDESKCIETLIHDPEMEARAFRTQNMFNEAINPPVCPGAPKRDRMPGVVREINHVTKRTLNMDVGVQK